MKDLRKAIKITDSCFSLARKLIRQDLTEKEIAREIKKHAKKLGAKRMAFDPIVSCGKNSSKIHPKVTNNKPKKNDFIIIDMGVVVGESRTDVTRTFCIEPSKKNKKLYKLVKTAQKLAEKKIKPGVLCKDVDKVARDFLRKNSKMKFPYSLGHGVGKRVHQYPKITPSSTGKLKIGDIFTLEPGLHSKTTGLRIEDMYLLTRKGIIKLTKNILSDLNV